MITRDQIKIGTVMRIGPVTYEVMFVKGYNVGLKKLQDGALYPEYSMQDSFLSAWDIVRQPMSINDIVLNEVYTDGTEKYRVVYKNGKCILAYIQDKVQEMPVLYTQDDISSWKKYVPPVVAKEYKIVWRRGGVNNVNKITAEFLPRNQVVKDPQNIIKTELISYTE